MSIEAIYKLGDDAFSNLFQIIISEDEEQLLELRAQSISIPASGHDKYSIDYMQFTIDRPKPKVVITKELTIPLRVDAEWNIYNWLRDKKNAALHVRSGNMASLPEIEFQISIKPLDPSGEVIDGAPTWNFYHCWVTGLPDVSFDYTNSDPITVDAQISFITMTDDE